MIAEAEPDFMPSATLVAVITAVAISKVAVGAVYSPVVLIVPMDADQVTDCDGEPVPSTCAANWRVPPPIIAATAGDTTTDVTVGNAAAGTVIVAVPDLLVSNVLVAVTMIVCADG